MKVNMPKSSWYVLGVAIILFASIGFASRSGLIRKIAIWNLPEEQITPEWKQTQYEANQLFRGGRYQEAETKHRTVLQLLEDRYGPEHHEVINAINTVAVTCLYQGKLSDAETLFLRSLDFSRKFFGEDDPRLHLPFDGLYQIHYERGEYDKAEHYAKLSLQIAETAFIGSDPRFVESMEALRSVYLKQGANDKAFQLNKRIVDMKLKDSVLGKP